MSAAIDRAAIDCADDRPALAGIRVLDLGELIPGPYAAQILGDLGAEVIKVERPGGDSARSNFAGLFRIANRDKKSVVLDLKDDAGRAAFDRLAGTADVLIEGFRPGVTDRLGIGYRRIAALNPRLVYVSVSGYGQTGPARDEPGHDVNYLAAAGALSLCGAPDGPAAHATGFPVADISASLTAAVAILAALRQRDVTGAGRYLDIAIADCILPMILPRLGTLQEQGTLSKRAILERAGYGVFTTSDDRQLAIGAIEDHFWAALVAAIDLPNLADARYRRFPDRLADSAALQARIRDRIAERPLAAWMERFRAHGVPANPVAELADIQDDPQIAARGHLVEEHGFRFVGFPGRLATGRAGMVRDAPALGADTATVLAGLTARPPGGAGREGDGHG